MAKSHQGCTTTSDLLELTATINNRWPNAKAAFDWCDFSGSFIITIFDDTLMECQRFGRFCVESYFQFQTRHNAMIAVVPANWLT